MYKSSTLKYRIRCSRFVKTFETIIRIMKIPTPIKSAPWHWCNSTCTQDPQFGQKWWCWNKCQLTTPCYSQKLNVTVSAAPPNQASVGLGKITVNRACIMSFLVFNHRWYCDFLENHRSKTHAKSSSKNPKNPLSI